MSGQSQAQATASAILARHALGVSFERISHSARTAVRQFTLDTIAVALGGAAHPHYPSLLGLTEQWGPGGAARLWTAPGRRNTEYAAFLHAFMAHAQEFDCVHEAAVLHPFTVVVPVLLAEAERSDMTGAEYIAACTAGVDVAAGLGVAATSQIRFFRPATCGLFGAIAALGRCRALTEAQLVNAFGYGLALASGTMQAHVEGTPALALQVANAARNAFQAVDIAQAGLPGPKGSIDGPFGYLSLFETASDLDPVIARLGKVWRAEEVSFKPFPTGRATHGGIDMIGRLRTSGLRAEDVERVEFSVTPLIMHLVGRPAIAAPDVNYARLCLPYCASAALIYGAVDLGAFTPEALRDPMVFALAQRVSVAPVANPDAAAFVPQAVRVTTRSGQILEARVEDLPGTPKRPLSRTEQRAKLESCIAYGWPDAPAGVADRLTAAIDQLEDLPIVAVLNALVAGEA